MGRRPDQRLGRDARPTRRQRRHARHARAPAGGAAARGRRGGRPLLPRPDGAGLRRGRLRRSRDGPVDPDPDGHLDPTRGHHRAGAPRHRSRHRCQPGRGAADRCGPHPPPARGPRRRARGRARGGRAGRRVVRFRRGGGRRRRRVRLDGLRRGVNSPHRRGHRRSRRGPRPLPGPRPRRAVGVLDRPGRPGAGLAGPRARAPPRRHRCGHVSAGSVARPDGRGGNAHHRRHRPLRHRARGLPAGAADLRPGLRELGHRADGRGQRRPRLDLRQRPAASAAGAGDPQRPVRIIGIAISDDADLAALRRIAEATGGRAHRADAPDDILRVFAQEIANR